MVERSGVDRAAMEQALDRAISAGCLPAQRDQLRHCVPHLIRLISEVHHQPVRDCETLIRRIILEQSQFSTTSEASAPTPPVFDREIQLVIEELERLRQAGIRDGYWSQDSVPPQMYG
ncbi:MAG: hypothetical protein OER86_06345 [Phycisphaerae bacterium]|nr:hypothetical protein [Phycisphaerae bacterium]